MKCGKCPARGLIGKCAPGVDAVDATDDGNGADDDGDDEDGDDTVDVEEGLDDDMMLSIVKELLPDELDVVGELPEFEVAGGGGLTALGVGYTGSEGCG